MFISQKIDNFVLKACRDFNTPESALQGLVYKKQHSIADKLILQQCFIQSKKCCRLEVLLHACVFKRLLWMNHIFHWIVTAKQPSHLNVSHGNFVLNEQRLGNKQFFALTFLPLSIWTEAVLRKVNICDLNS